MRRRTKKSVRRHGAPRRDFKDDAPESSKSTENLEPLIADGDPLPAYDDAAQSSSVKRDEFENFLANYTPPKPRRSRVMQLAVVVSLALHLSTVTIFSIVIYFPREDIQYYDLRFVPMQSAAAGGGFVEGNNGSTGENLRLGSALEATLGEAVPQREGLSLRPRIQLPTLETATLDRLRIRQETLGQREEYARLFGERSPDSWARFGEGIGRLRDALAGSEETATSLGVGNAENEAAPAPVTFKPADGFMGLVIWDTAANQRDLLFSPPIRALYNLNAADFDRGIEVVFEVNGGGRVTNVWSPTLDESGLVDDVQATILQFRFEPSPAEGRDAASGVIRIRREASGP